MALKNAYSSKPIDRIFGDIQKALATHGAKQITFEYGDDGKVYGISFVVPFNGKMLPIKLPAQVDKASQLLREQGFKYDNNQMYRVAWRNIEDWVEAQLAFIDIGQVQMEQVFLPYIMTNQGVTLFEQLKNGDFLRLESTKDNVQENVQEGEVV